MEHRGRNTRQEKHQNPPYISRIQAVLMRSAVASLRREPMVRRGSTAPPGRPTDGTSPSTCRAKRRSTSSTPTAADSTDFTAQTTAAIRSGRPTEDSSPSTREPIPPPTSMSSTQTEGARADSPIRNRTPRRTSAPPSTRGGVDHEAVVAATAGASAARRRFFVQAEGPSPSPLTTGAGSTPRRIASR